LTLREKCDGEASEGKRPRLLTRASLQASFRRGKAKAAAAYSAQNCMPADACTMLSR
jgi:hypothetical protein